MKMTHLLYRDCEKFECLLAYARGKSLAIQWSRQRPQLHIIANCRLLHMAAPLKGAALAHHHALEHNSLRLRVVRHQHLRWQQRYICAFICGQPESSFGMRALTALSTIVESSPISVHSNSTATNVTTRNLDHARAVV